MKILLAQINTIVGDIEGNSEKVWSAIENGKTQSADLVVFPELTLTGYPPQDLLEFPWFVDKNIAALQSLAKITDENTAAIIGFVDKNESKKGKGLLNSAALLGNGEILSKHNKTLLPTYDVFDEGRWFKPATEVKPAEWRGKKIGVTICEDAWNSGFYWLDPYYDHNPIDDLEQLNIDVLINISASPYTLGKREIKKRIFSGIAKQCRVPLVHVNLVGGNDGLIFDGWSNVFGPDGRLFAQAKDFAEQELLVDIATMTGEIENVNNSDESQLYNALTLGVRDYVKKCGFKKVVIGLSGGIDSALTAVLAVEALGAKNVIGVSMPSRYSSDHSKDDARILAENLGIEFHTIAIEKMFSAFLNELDPLFAGHDPDTTEENIQARCRGVTLMSLSNKFNWLVLSTGNKSENAVGYATLYGDMCGGLAVISDLPKTIVFKLSRWINCEKEIIPWNTIEKPPSAELRPDQKDSDSLPDYDELDPIIEAYVENNKSVQQIIADGFDPTTVKRIIRMINLNEYKRRQAAPGLKVTSKAFGWGRRMPIAGKY